MRALGNIARTVLITGLVRVDSTTSPGRCDAGWTEVASDCFKAVSPSTTSEYANINDARQDCLSLGSDIASLPPGTPFVTQVASYLGTNRINSSVWETLEGGYLPVLENMPSDYCSRWNGQTLDSVKCIDPRPSVTATICKKPIDGTAAAVADADNLFYQLCVAVNPCAGSPCENGGTCLDRYLRQECVCTVDYWGPTCTNDVHCTDTDIPALSHVTQIGPTTLDAEGTVTFTCDTGYMFRDRTTELVLTCRNNQWETADGGTSVSSCSLHCPEASTILSSHSSPLERVGSHVGHMQNFTCDQGYRFEGTNDTTFSSTCTPAQTWDPATLPPCIEVICPPLEDFEHQELNTDHHNYETTATLTCDVGYSLVDDTTARTVYCMAQADWSADQPQCDAVSCPQIPDIKNGERNDSSHAFGTYAKFDCLDGYRMLDGAITRTISCDATGTWSADVTDCEDNRCYPLPYVGNASPNSFVATVGSVVTFTCIQGHRFTARTGQTLEYQSMQCMPSKLWDPLFTMCHPVKCPVLAEELANQRVHNVSADSEERLYEAQVKLVCDKGHYYADNSSYLPLECLGTEQWNVTQYQSCAPVQCVAPPELDVNGTRVTVLEAPFLYLEEISYTCLEDYKFIDGQQTRTIYCDEFGHWSDEDVSCLSERCDPVPTADNTYPDTENTSWHTIVNYTCNAGFQWARVNTARSTLCDVSDDMASWSPAQGSLDHCLPIPCPEITTEPIANTTHNSTDPADPTQHEYGSYITYNCTEGHAYADEDLSMTRYCNIHGVWEPPIAELFFGCEVLTCPELSDVPNATMSPNDTVFWGTTVTFTCYEGFQFPDKELARNVTCATDSPTDTFGTWNWIEPDPDPTEHDDGRYCEVVYCPPIPYWDDTVWFNSTENGYQETILYHCAVNYTFVLGEAEAGAEALYTPFDFVPVILMPGLQSAVEGEPATVPALISYCGEDKQWYPPIAPCSSTAGLLDDVVAEDAPEAIPIATTAMALLVVLLILIVLLDLHKLYTDIRMAHRNVKDRFGRRSNKISNSSLDVGGGASPEEASQA